MRRPFLDGIQKQGRRGDTSEPGMNRGIGPGLLQGRKKQRGKKAVTSKGPCKIRARRPIYRGTRERILEGQT